MSRARNGAAFGSAALCLVTLMFLILLNVGNTSNHHVLGDMYFLKLDTSKIVPSSVPGANLKNSQARSLGLHDFYQVGLWNFCEGYNVEGITACSKPVAAYWFNPVQIILDELLNGATGKLCFFFSWSLFPQTFLLLVLLIFLSLSPLSLLSLSPYTLSIANRI